MVAWHGRRRSLRPQFLTRLGVGRRPDAPLNGSFSKRTRSGRDYWYYNAYNPDTGGEERKRSTRYVGPVDDPEITARVERFGSLKADYRERRRMISALKAGGLPAPQTPFVGDVVEALWKAGAFRLRCVLIGTVAYNTYDGLLGYRLPRHLTGDIDLAQFHAISFLVDDSIPPVLDVLREVDHAFREVPNQADDRHATKFTTGRFTVEFLTPNRSKDNYQGKPAPMPALGGAAAQPLCYLDYLIYRPARSVMLHNAGIPVWVPAPERYAVHKLIVATRRRDDLNGQAKRDKDLRQAGDIIAALSDSRRHHDLAEAWTDAWERGPRWQEQLVQGRSALPNDERDMLREAVLRACRDTKDDPAAIGFGPEPAVEPSPEPGNEEPGTGRTFGAEQRQ
ncbi:nucleotidyltransferase family protein [Azospirillum argentinense]|uniref:nucleotidyltransferase family protein n=1 Tax=Azospirillum argentinense TaxID=2970906 RepID=UPI0010BFEDED|nr:GSU2403 family nucleotidyltransferase fold protein [Azospirillum argentinense]